MRNNNHCLNCGAPVAPEKQECLYCGTSYKTAGPNPLGILKNKSFRMNALYPMLIGAGLTILIYIYAFAFNNFSETQMVNITPLWFFFITFGLYGFFAEKMMNHVIAGQGKDISSAYRKWLQNFVKKHILMGLILGILLLPFNFLNTRNSLLIAFLGSAIWGLILLFFFAAIFPAL